MKRRLLYRAGKSCVGCVGLAALLLLGRAPGQPPVYAFAETAQWIATYTGEVPGALQGKPSVTAAEFSKDFETVTKEVDGVRYHVEVVPRGLRYFIDSKGAYADAGALQPYQAVERLLSDKGKASLLNESPDKAKTAADGAAWGYEGAVVATKSPSSFDKNDTGIYGANKSGNSISYSFSLPKGSYQLVSAHKEWWNSRKLNYALKTETGTGAAVLAAGSIDLKSKGSVEQAVMDFELTEDSRLSYTVTATGDNAPLISWLAVLDKSEGGGIQPSEEDNAEAIILRGADVDAASAAALGLSFKGFGMVSCNGTSNLLMDYKAEAPEKYQELLETLFGGEHPLLSHVKIEMGNDGNTSTAAEPATIRYEGEEADASRSPGWQLASDAKSVNPEVKISILRWRSPNWTNGNTNTPKIYEWYRDTIFDAYEKYGILPDYIAPGVNEASGRDVQNTMAQMAVDFRKLLDEEQAFPEYMDEAAQQAYHAIKIVSADELKSWEIVNQMKRNQAVKDAVDAMGSHYTTGTDQAMRTLVDSENKESWYSEGCANFGFTPQSERRTDTYVAMGGKQGPLAMADGFLNAFCGGRMTHYLFQPAVGAFYDGL